MDVLAARRTETQRRIPTEFLPCFCRVPVSSFVASRFVRQLYAEMAKNERQSPERAQDGDKFLQEFYQGRFIFETDFFHLHISLEEVLKMQILFSCQSIHLTWKKPTGDASLGCLHTRWRRNLRPRRCVPRHGCTGEA